MIAPMKPAPTTMRATASQAGEPASIPAATKPTNPMAGASRSRTGGNSGRRGRSAARRGRYRSWRPPEPTDASTTSRWPATPAARRLTETAMATAAARTTPRAAASRTGTGPIVRAVRIDPAAIMANTTRMIHASRDPLRGGGW